MSELLTGAQMRTVEQAAISTGEVSGLELMERAGRGVVEAVFEEWPELAKTSYRALVLCGPGNNGGDGFVVARLLKDWGWQVEVFLYGAADKLPPDARANYLRWVDMGSVQSIGQGSAPSPGPRLVIDALFGTGTSRRLPDEIVRLLLQVSDTEVSDTRDETRFVGIDCFSGDDLDSGRTLGRRSDNPLRKNLTVSFHTAKVGHYLAPLAGRSDSLRVKDIGLPDQPEPFRIRLATPMLSRLRKGGADHKFAHGHALILSGGPGKTGAARLAARGALRIGAGLVTLAVPPAAQSEVAEQITSIMPAPMANSKALASILADDRLNALCLGPGLGVGDSTKELVAVALTGGAAHSDTCRRGIVLDADALTSFADRPQELFDLLHAHCVLTPHGGEFARLFPDIAEKLAAAPTKGPAFSKVDATRKAAARAGCIVLFKGPDTVIAAPNGQCSINSAHYRRAAPWLATAGSGDVLAGFVAGLMARGCSPMQAAETAAWLHVECALSYGPGLIAEDIPEELPKIFRTLGV